MIDQRDRDRADDAVKAHGQAGVGACFNIYAERSRSADPVRANAHGKAFLPRCLYF